MAERQTAGVQTLQAQTVEDLRRELQFALQHLANQVDQLQGNRGTPTFRADVNLSGKRLTNLGTPRHPQDAVPEALALTRASAQTSYDAGQVGIINLPAGTATSDAVNVSQLREALQNSDLSGETFVVVSLSSRLTQERQLAAEATVITLTDGGAGSTLTISVTANGITNAKLRQSGALTVIGRSANSTGNVADVAAVAASDAVLRESGSTLAFGTVATAGLADNAVTDGKLRDSAAVSVVGRSANSGGDPADIAASANGNILRRAANAVGFGQVDVSDGTNAVTGVLAMANGGTGSATLVLASGVYTPTLTGVANVGASTPYEFQYLRLGTVVTVSGKVDVDPTAPGATQLGISLPVASNLGAAEDCAGVGASPGIAGQSGAILGDVANDRAELNWVAVDLTNQAWYVHFSYAVI